MDGSVAFGRCGRLGPAMTRCECAETGFDELANRMRATGADLDAVQVETGAGLLCSACLPDLRQHLEAAGLPTPAPGGASCVSESDLALGAAGDEGGARFAGAGEPR